MNYTVAIQPRRTAISTWTGWAFDRFTTLLKDKAKAEGIDVELVSERDTSKSCSACRHIDDNHSDTYVSRSHFTGYTAVIPGESIRNCWGGVVSEYVFSTRTSPSTGSFNADSTV